MARRNPLGAWARLVGRNLALIQRNLQPAGRLANAQGCWNWFSTRHGPAAGEAALLLQAISQVCLLHPVDASRIAAAGLSAGASMAALLASLQPQRFKAVVMHSGIPPGTADSGLSALGAMRGGRRTRPLDASAEAMATDWPALLVIHGSADRVVAPANAQAAVQAWAMPGAAAPQASPLPTRTAPMPRAWSGLLPCVSLASRWPDAPASAGWYKRGRPDHCAAEPHDDHRPLRPGL